jgi:glycerol-3-phosphate dehydrogenase
MKRNVELSFRTRRKNLSILAEKEFDVLVIGGGITGVGVARDAALRGLSVAVVERRDFACGTSSRSSKLIHGGLRYLQQGDVGLVREAATERYALRKLAPHLARPRQMVVPAGSRASYAKLSVGLWTYDRIAGVSDDERYRMLSKDEALQLEPLLRAERLYGAGLYYEYLTDDARLVMEVMKSAASMGAVVANYAAVVGFELGNGRIQGVDVRDELTGDEIRARARVVVNGAGPWVDAVRLMGERGEKPRLHLTKGIHLGIRRERLDLSRIVVMNARDKRGVFAIPRGAVTYLGTTDTSYLRPEDDPQITMEDVTYLLDAANRTFAVSPLDPRDVASAWAGLRPLLHQEGKKPSELSRKDEVMIGANGLVSVAGGKLTTFRRMAERVVDIVVDALKKQQVKLPAPIGKSEEALLTSGDTSDDVEGYAQRLCARWPRVGPDIVDRLVELYGSNAERLVEAMSADPLLAERLSPGLPVTQAEVQYSVREEMAINLEDFLERRTRLSLWDSDNGIAVAAAAARAMGAMLGWDEKRVESEVSRYRAHVDSVKSFLVEEPETEPRQVAHG